MKELEGQVEEIGQRFDKMSLLVLDIKKLKAVNARFGYRVGDRYLELVKTLVEELAKKYGGTAMPTGGDSFALIMPRVGLRVAKQRAEEFRRRQHATPLKLDGGAEFSMSSHVGVVEWKRRESAERLLARAFRALDADRAQELFSVKDELYKALDDFDAVVCETTKEVVVEDQRRTEALAQLLRMWVMQPDWVDQVPNDTRVDCQPNIMRRVHLFNGKGTELRLHLFDDPSETLKHNHGANFFSSCLAGHYKHKVWQVVNTSSKSHYRFNRTEDPELQIQHKVSGDLEAGLVHRHQPGQTYFISKNTAHTVKAEENETSGEPQMVVTMYLRGALKKCDTVMLSSEKAPDWGGKNGKEYELHGREREQTLREIASLVRGEDLG